MTLLTPEYTRLDRIHAAIAGYPRFNETQRRILFECIDMLPDAGAEWDERSEYAKRWRIVRELWLGSSPDGRAVNLFAASGHCTQPTATDVIRALEAWTRVG